MFQGLFRRVSLIALGVAGLTTSAGARSLAEIRASGALSCGGAIRPGLAMPGPDGAWRGIEPDLCRDVATALLGPGARFRFRSHGLPADPLAPEGVEDLSFLTESEFRSSPPSRPLQTVALLGDLAFVIAVADAAPARHLADLGAALICAEPGTDPERGLEAFILSHGLSARTFMFQEDEERLDAFDAGRCDAIAGEAVSLAAWAANRPMRLLPEPYGSVRLLAATPAGDAPWATLVASVLRPHGRSTLQGNAP